MKHRYQSFTRIGRQFQSLERHVYADWTSVSFPFCQKSYLVWRIMTNTLTNTMTNTYVVIFLSVSIFGRGYHSRYQNFEFTGSDKFFSFPGVGITPQTLWVLFVRKTLSCILVIVDFRIYFLHNGTPFSFVPDQWCFWALPLKVKGNMRNTQ